MSRKVRTARGSTLDFDLLKIKQQMATAPQSLHVRKRKDFIEQRLRRRVKKVAQARDETKKGVVAADMDVTPTLPNTEVVEEKQELIEVQEPKPTKPTAPRQKARKKTTADKGEENATKSDI